MGDDRFVIKTTSRPRLVSNESYDEGIEENRRVEFSSSDPSILGPVVHSRFYEYVPSQPRHQFRVDVRNAPKNSGWNLSVYHRGNMIGGRGGSLVPPSTVTFDLDQEMTDQIGPVIGSVDTLDAQLRLNPQGTGSPIATTRFPLVKTTSNYEVSRLSLIVFDYDRADITKANKTMMKRVISGAVRDGSVATIVGSTDRLGEEDHNKELSSDRARTVDRFTRSIAPSLEVEDVRGIGSSELPYDNALPEGRFYCRTVSLTIKTPLR